MDGVEWLGLVVPRRELIRFQTKIGEFEGLPNLGVSHVAQCAKLCTSFNTALDVGAHIGGVSAYLARHFRRVVAFEPVPETFEFLQHNTARWPHVETLNMAAAEGAGEVCFSHYRRHGQLSHVAGSSEDSETDLIGPIPTAAIDSMNLTDVSFIKIDVEGYELPVVQGARETIVRCRPLIMMEQGGNEEKHFGKRRHEASEFLEGLGMRRHPDEPRMNKDRLYTF